MKQVAEHLFSRGKHGKLYCRIRIPTKLQVAYARKREITRALGTSDRREAKDLLITELAVIKQEFALKERELALKAAQRAERSMRRLTALSDVQLQALAGNWVHQALLTDDDQRSRGLSDDEFDALDAQLHEQRRELGRMLSQGKVERILPAMRSFLHLLGVEEVELAPEQERQAAYKFLEAVVQTLDVRLERQSGNVRPTAALKPDWSIPELTKSLSPAKTKTKTWDEVFAKWVDHVDDRCKPTVIAAQTPWRELQRVALDAGVKHPGEVTKEIVNRFVEGMVERGLATATINDRLGKVKAIYAVAVGKLLLDENPAQDVIGRGKSALEKRRKKRLTFDQADLNNIFSCSIYNGAHERSKGCAKEASYWIPLLMFYTGARTEEVAGLALVDLVFDERFGWYFNIIDRPEQDDSELFDDDDDERKVKTEAHARLLKNAASIRRVPVARELIDLGLLNHEQN